MKVPSLRLRSGPGPTFWVLAISGLVGFRIGLVGFPTWHICVETAQVVAGLVKYPPDNPFYIYHTKLWSLLIQTCAVLLKAGLSEITLSLLLSGLLAMISFQAIAMVTYAISRDALVAITAAVVVFVSGATDYGAIYPVWLAGTHHSYGAFGLSTFVLMLGLLGAGCYRSGAFLLGIGPAIHPSVGVLVGSIALAALIQLYPSMRDELRPAAKYFVAGCAATLLSAAVQFIVVYDVPAVDQAAVDRSFSMFLREWDAHRRASVGFADPAVLLNRTAMALAVVWLIGFARDLPRTAAFLLRVIAVAGVLSLGVVLSMRLSLGRLPTALSILMPGRLLNLNVVLLAPLLLGVVAAYRRRRAAQALLIVLMTGLLFAPNSLLWRWMSATGRPAWTTRVDPVWLLETGALMILCVALWYTVRGRTLEPGPEGAAAPRAALLFRTSIAGVLVVALTLSWRVVGSRSIFRDRTNDPFYAAVAADRRGLTVTAGSFQLVQLYTRRPVLIDSGALDTMVYAPEGGPATARIITDVYGIDFFDPPREIRSGSVIPHNTNKYTWARFPTQRWRELRRTYNVSQIVARSDYELDLPIVAEAEGLRLYRIPD